MSIPTRGEGAAQRVAQMGVDAPLVDVWQQQQMGVLQYPDQSFILHQKPIVNMWLQQRQLPTLVLINCMFYMKTFISLSTHCILSHPDAYIYTYRVENNGVYGFI